MERALVISVGHFSTIKIAPHITPITLTGTNLSNPQTAEIA